MNINNFNKSRHGNHEVKVDTNQITTARAIPTEEDLVKETIDFT